MSIKAGQIVHTGNTVLVERLQSASAGVNIPSTRVSELGNYKAVAVTHDTPDLTFTMESWDASCALEKLLTGDATTPWDLTAPKPLTIASEWLAGQDTATPFKVVEGVVIPQLALESISYRFGLAASAATTVTLRGDSIYYCPNPPIVETFDGTADPDEDYELTHPAGLYDGDLVSGPRRALNVSVNGQRLFLGVDYTEAEADISPTPVPGYKVTTITLLAAAGVGTDNVQIAYFTNDAVSVIQSDHTDPAVKPAAVRGKDISVFLGGVDLSDLVLGVQSVQIDERFTISVDNELGNPNATATDYADAPAVTGNLVIRPRNPAEFHARLAELFNVSDLKQAIGGGTFEPIRLDVVLHHPDTGDVLKALEVTDAVFTIPGYDARVTQKLDMTFNFESNAGNLAAMDTAPV